MKLIYTENYGKLKSKDNTSYTCNPIIEIHNFDKNILPNLFADEYFDIDENTVGAKINLNYGFFESLSDKNKEILETIFNFSKLLFKTEYIDRKIWSPFLLTSGVVIPSKTKSLCFYEYNIIKEFPSFDFNKAEQLRNYYNSEKLVNDCMSENQYSLYKNFYLKMLSYNQKKLVMKEKYSNFKLSETYDFGRESYSFLDNFTQLFSISYEMDISSESDLFYSILDCIFLSDYNFHIKKCERKDCSKVFITTNLRTRYCERKYNGFNCSEILSKERKRAYEDDQLIKLERKVNNFIYAYRNYATPSLIEEREKLKTRYITEKRDKKNAYKDGKISKQELINWFKNFHSDNKIR